ncbi:MAG: lamin tail domain-containing protein [Candidatus Paceibacterota bacterium]|jgi:hypothetical protein
MSKKLILVLTMGIFFSGFSVANAALVINEFVSDPDSGSEWIELKNDSSSEINLDGWSWTELASPGGDTEHESSQKNLSGTVSANGFFVFEMSSALNNAGDSIGLYNGGNLVDRVSFGTVAGYSKNLDASAKGKSGALVSGNWQTNQVPTKGGANASGGSSENNSEDNNDSNSSQGSSSSSDTPATVATPAKIKTEVTVRSVAYVGIPQSFQGKVMQGGTQLSHGRYFWNFGDGDFREVKVINTDKFTHTYYYPGDYTIVFEYYPDHFAEEPEATTKINIKVIKPEVTISRVGDASDFFVELMNNTSYDVDLSLWKLSSHSKSFTIPKNTNIFANKKLIISGRTSGLNISDLPGLKLVSPDQETIFEYFSYAPSAKAIPKAPKSVGVNNSQNLTPELVLGDDDTSFRNLGANVALADAGDDYDTSGLFSSLIWPVVFLGFMSVSAYAVYLVRQKKASPNASDEFEILDE